MATPMNDAANGGGERVMALRWSAARIVHEPRSFRLKGLHLTDHRFEVPLDYSGALPGTIEIFVREVLTGGATTAAGGEAARSSGLPYLLYLQGGPGFECPRLSEAGEFIRKLAREHRLLLLDQRGTGLSTPVSVEALDGMSVAQRVAYLRCFRADSIVRDAELVRRALLEHDGRWSILGQSFGGFCVLTYLSFFPWALEKALLCGGLAPVGAGCSAESVYRALAPRALRQMDRYYELFPDDAKVLREVVLHIDQQPGGNVALPSGSVLSVRGLQALGFGTLGVPGGFARLHYLLERCWTVKRVSGERVLSYNFLKAVDNALAFDTNPIYLLLHEAIYCNGAGAPAWAAERVLREYSAFDAVKAARSGGRIYLTGEMCFPWMLEEFAALRPWKETAHALAAVADWGPLYSEVELKANTVPTGAVVYYGDMMVDFDFSMRTAGLVNNCNVWLTNEYSHSGLREGADRVTEMLTKLIAQSLTLER